MYEPSIETKLMLVMADILVSMGNGKEPNKNMYKELGRLRKIVLTNEITKRDEHIVKIGDDGLNNLQRSVIEEYKDDPVFINYFKGETK